MSRQDTGWLALPAPSLTDLHQPGSLSAYLLRWPRVYKRLLVLGVDVVSCVFTVWLALSLRLETPVVLDGPLWWPVWGALALSLPIFVRRGLYRAIFRYSGSPALRAVTGAVGLYALLYAAWFTGVGMEGVPRSVGIIQPVLLLVTVGATRALARFWLGGVYQRSRTVGALPRVLIYGAGDAGRQLADAMSHSNEMHVVGFLDDDVQMQGGTLQGLRVHDPAKLESLVGSLDIGGVLLALPTVTRQRRNEILRRVSSLQLAVRTLPGLLDLAHGTVRVSDLREIEIDDLLGRDIVPPNPVLLNKNIAGKVVLITGAGGSIGGELCRQVLAIRPLTLLLVERNEFALYTIHAHLVQRLANMEGPLPRIVPLLASVFDEPRMRHIMRSWKPNTVYHAAAYKHVPLVEHNPAEGVRNNVFGTLVSARVAMEQQVEDFVLISTDKAVRPTNVMGTSKRLAEMILQALAHEPANPAASQAPNRAANENRILRDAPRTRFSMVRFGNVLGSSGSVVPHFRQQIKDGGPITLTHPDITRYFMTIPEAAQLVIQAGAMATGGEVFVLDMGEPVRIIDLARRMVELSGMTVRDATNPHGDIELSMVGLRPGEKLYEELLIGDNPMATGHSRIMKARDAFLPWAELAPFLTQLTALIATNDVAGIRRSLQHLVPGYSPEDSVSDWVHLEQQRAAA